MGAVPTAQDCKLTTDSHQQSSPRTPPARRHFQASAAPTNSGRAGLALSSRLLILAPLALLLLWEVTTRSLTAYLANDSPETALLLQSNYPTAVLNLAADKLNVDPRFENIEPTRRASDFKKGSLATEDIEDKAQAPAENSNRSVGNESQSLAEIRSWAELALLNDPLDAQAFRILGQVSQGASDGGQADRFMQGAVRRSLQESVAVYWMMRKSYDDYDYRAALRYGDILLRTRPNAMPHLMPMFAKIAENPAAGKDLKLLLAANPPWRKPFFFWFPRSVWDARAPLELLMSLKDSSNPPTAAELSGYIDLLVEHEFYDLAYYTWLQFLPSEQLSKAGYLFNGSFEIPPSATLFDWKFSKGSGAIIQIAPRPDRDREHALYAQFGPGRVADFGVSEMITLPPGDYELQGSYKSQINSPRGLLWRVTCAPKPTNAIGETPAVNGASPTWQAFQVSFTVPEKDCSAQYLALALDARAASEQFISGSVWYDDLQITRQQLSKP